MSRLTSRVTVLLALLLLAMLSRAGGGPAGFLVVYDQDDPVSVAVANHYQQARGIPESNMIPLSIPASLDNGNAWKLVEAIRAHIAAHGLGSQVQGIALAGFLPLGARIVKSNATLSLACILYDVPNNTDPDAFPKAGNNAAYHTPPASPTVCLNGYTPIDGRTYWPVSFVGPTDHAALSPRAAMVAIDQAKAADGARPQGVIYWPLNSDIRSVCREPEIAQVTPVWEKMGIRYSITQGNWVKSRGDIVGGVTGFQYTDVAQDDGYLPGAWVDHLTSFGGVLVDNWQMPCTDFLLAGAGGSAGTMNEPYAISGKFPHAHIFTHFRNGASLAEAFWQSIQQLAEILPVGDPLMQPYAVFPKVTVAGPKPGATVRGTGKIAVTTGSPVLEPNLDLFVDGRLVKIGDAAEPVKATRSAAGFTLDSTSLTDGWHELRVVAYAATPVRTQGEAVLPLIVANKKQAVTLTGPAQVAYEGPNTFTVATANLPNITGVELRANGRVLASAPAAGALTVAPLAFPYTGACALYAVATLADGRAVSSAPFTVTSVWTPRPATPAPALGPGPAHVRYFASTLAPNFSWDGAPTLEFPLDEAACQYRRLTCAMGSILGRVYPDWAKDFSKLPDPKAPKPAVKEEPKRPGMELTAWWWVPRDDIYEFEPIAGELLIDGVVPTPEKNKLLGPLPLQAGWHRLRMRVTLFHDQNVIKLQMRGGPIGKLGEVPACWFSAPAAADAPPAPNVAIVKADGAPIGKEPVVVTGTKVTLTADGAPDLRYAWYAVSAPRVGAEEHPDYQAEVTVGTTSKLRWQEPTITFSVAGDYLIRVKAGDGKSYGTADVRVIVQPVITSLSVTAAKTMPDVKDPKGPAVPMPVTAGDGMDLYAVVQDQFGRRLPNPPAVAWTPQGGTCEALSGETARFTAGKVAGPAQVTASAAGKTAAVTLTIAENQPPKLTAPLSFMPNGNNTIRLNASVTDPDDPARRHLTYQWSLEQAPPGQKIEFITPTEMSTLAKPSGSGEYLVKFTATDGGGATVSDTLKIKLVMQADGALIYAPAPRLFAPQALLTQMVTLTAGNLFGPAEYRWETSADGGATWQPVPNAAENKLRYGPVTLADKDRLFRVTARNELGAAVSDAVKLTINDPKGGIIATDRDVIVTPPDAKTVTVTVHRLLHATGKVVVDYLLFQNYAGQKATPAKAGVDYADAKGTLTWEDGDATDRTITITLLPRADAPGRGFTVFLKQMQGESAMQNIFTRVWLASPEEPDGPKP